MGMGLTPTYALASKCSGKTLNIFSYPKRAIKMIILSIVLALLINVTNIYGISQIPVGKSILVFSLNPIFWIVLAHFFLGEKELPLFSTLGAFAGIYFLTINKPQESEGKHNVLLGFAWAFLSSWLQAMIMIVVRILNIFQVHPFFRPLYIGMGFVIMSMTVKIWSPDSLIFPNYQPQGKL